MGVVARIPAYTEIAHEKSKFEGELKQLEVMMQKFRREEDVQVI